MSDAQSILENAKSLFDRGDRGGALILLQRLEGVEFSRPDPMMLGAYASFQAGDKDLAERLMRRVVAAQPGLPAAHHNLSKVLLGLGRLPEAAESAGRAARLAPNDVTVHETLGVVMERLGRPDSAEEMFRRCVALDPDNPALHDNLGRMLEKQAKDVDALVEHRRALELDPRGLLALRGAVTVHRMSGDGADQRAQRPCEGEPGCAP